MCTDVLPACISRLQMSSACQSQKRDQVPWNWSYKQLWATMLVLGTEPRISGRVASVLMVLCHLSSPIVSTFLEMAFKTFCGFGILFCSSPQPPYPRPNYHFVCICAHAYTFVFAYMHVKVRGQHWAFLSLFGFGFLREGLSIEP